MGKPKKTTPEERARWAAARREMEESIARLTAQIEERRAWEERRRRRLRKLSFGLLGR